jgi:NAD(P)-dependent dehydrogenase (short-subunit alcohol dehydrogenase family)
MIRRAWLVTGTTTGFGLATVKELLHQGYQVAATTRSLDTLLSALRADSVHPNLLPLNVNMSSDHSIHSAVSTAIKEFGQLDVLVNNAGFGAIGAIEEFDREDILRQFDINFIAAHSFMKSVLPHFRLRRNGHILNLGSIASFDPTLNWGIYAASKAALAALGDALADEVAPFRIKITSVMPGPFASNFRNHMSFSKDPIPDYSHVHDAKAKLMASSDIGSTEKAAKLFVKLANDPNPPKWIFLGAQAVDRAAAKSRRIAQEIAQWKDEALATDGSG